MSFIKKILILSLILICLMLIIFKKDYILGLFSSKTASQKTNIPLIDNTKKLLPTLSYKSQTTSNFENLKKEADALSLVGELQKARDKYKETLKFSANDYSVLKLIADVSVEMNDYPSAEEYYLKSISSKDTDNSAYYDLANLYKNILNQKNKAIQLYEMLIVKEPQNITGRLLLAQLHEETDKNKARELYNQILVIEPNNNHALKALNRL